MIKIVYGEDLFNIEKFVANEVKKAEENGIDIIKFNKKSLETLPMELAKNSFFTKKRMFLIKDKLEKINKSVPKNLIDSLKIDNENTTIFFIENMFPKGKMASFLKGNAEIINFNKPKDEDIVAYIKTKTNIEGGEISPLAAERLFSFVGADLYQLEEEIAKLLLYKKDEKGNEVIQASDVEEIVKSSFESNIFEFMDAISGKNLKRSQELLNIFLESGENEIYILTMIARQFRNIAMAKLEPNINQDDLAKKARIHPFVAQKSIAQAKNFEQEEIYKIYEKIQEADLKLKSGYQGSHVLEEFLLNI